MQRYSLISNTSILPAGLVERKKRDIPLEISAYKLNFDQVTNVLNVSKYFMQIRSIFHRFRGVCYVITKLCDDMTKSLGDEVCTLKSSKKCTNIERTLDTAMLTSTTCVYYSDTSKLSNVYSLMTNLTRSNVLKGVIPTHSDFFSNSPSARKG